MAILETLPPAESSEKFDAWLSRGKTTEVSAFRGDPYGKSLATKVFHVGLNEIMSETGFALASPVSWRHIHTDSHGPCAIEIQIANEESEHRLLEVDRGNMVEEYKSLLATWDQIEEFEKEDYEIAYLRIFALKIGALWLRAADRKNDYFIPIPPHFHSLVTGKLYPADQFLEIARQAVRTFVSGGDSYTNDPFLGG